MRWNVHREPPVLAADDYNVQSVEVRSCGEFRAGFDLHSPSLTPASRAFPLNFQSQERYEKKQKGTRQGIFWISLDEENLSFGYVVW